MNKTCVFVNTTEPPLSSKFISFRTKRVFTSFTNSIKLFAIYEDVYPHPDAPQYATVTVITEKFLGEFKETDKNFSAVCMLHWAIENLRLVCKKVFNF